MVDWEIEVPKEFIAESYYYLINGKKYWRVTRVKSVINQEGLTRWRISVGSKESNRILKLRQNIGTKVHKLFELTLLGNIINPDNYDEEVKEDLALFADMIKDCGLEMEGLEQRLWNNGYNIAGTCDYIGKYTSNKKYLKKKAVPKFNNDLVVGDWKTASGIYPDYWLQLSAYVYMFESLTNVKPRGAFIALFRNNKLLIEEKTYDELMKYFEVFKHCIKIFEYTKGEF